MSPDTGHEKAGAPSHAGTWFVTERPVEGTVFVKPADAEKSVEEKAESARDSA